MARTADPRTRIELLRAAEAIFSEYGLAAAKVEDITARAGVSKGSFYLHFESKEDCFRQIVEAFIAKLANCVDPPPDPQENLKGPEQALEVIETWHQHDIEILEFCWQNRVLFRMILAGGGGAPYAYLIDEFAARVAHNLEHWLRYAIEIGMYRKDLDPAVTAMLIAGAYDRLARELILQPKRPDIPAWCRQAMHLFVRGLLTEEARAVVDRVVKSSADSPTQGHAPTESGPRLSVGAAKDPERGKRTKSK